jgi:Zn-dependent peptidase ImmA (M78 family)
MMVVRGREKRTGHCLEKARAALASYGRGRAPLKPPVRIESVAEWLGFQVILLHTVGEEFSGLVSARQKLIGVNGRHHRHRRRFTIGHELSHILLKHPPESHCTPQEITFYNSEADECAAELLIPSALLSRWMPIARDVKNLAYAFDVSEEAMAVKVRQFGASGTSLLRFPSAVHPRS